MNVPRSLVLTLALAMAACGGSEPPSASSTTVFDPRVFRDQCVDVPLDLAKSLTNNPATGDSYVGLVQGSRAIWSRDITQDGTALWVVVIRADQRDLLLAHEGQALEDAGSWESLDDYTERVIGLPTSSEVADAHVEEAMAVVKGCLADALGPTF